MIHVLVKLTVKNFTALETFERKAARIMVRYEGQILTAFETIRNENNTGEEIHILAFPDEAAFLAYRADAELVELAKLRDEAIIKTDIHLSLTAKSYH
ncbi:DUF1330 domain-containing protein [Marinomonas agarivorans]|nr:DUF1330 domain-containing protein [Marinomonas agarivorans]